MQAKRLALAAGAETAFEFDHYASNSVVVKNETAGEILFCDGPFDAAKAAHIPAFSWQALNVRVFPGEKPKFYVRAAADGTVEIDFGSSGAGVLINELTSDVELAEGTDVQAYLLKGISTAEGSKTTLIDGSKNLAANLLAGKSIKFTVGGVEYLRKIVSNTENTITFGELVAAAPATAAIEKAAGGKVTITAVPEGAYANEYQVEVVQGEGVSAETEAEFADGVLAITLGTNSEEEPNATAADVADKVGALDGFSAAATTAGLLEALDEPVQFAGGVDEVKTLDEVEYYVIDGDEKFTDENPATVQLSGSIPAGTNEIGSFTLSGSKVVDAVIAQNETDSTEIDFRNYKYMAIQMPAGWDAATLTIKGSATAGGTKQTITNDAGVAFPAMTVAANGIYAIDLHALKIAAIPYLALVASAAQTTAARTIKVMLEQ